jgi:hypothetical protein
MERRFGSLVHRYEFGWSLAGLQARHQMYREKMALNPSFVAESRVGRVINFIKCQYWEKNWKATAMCNFQTLRFSAMQFI